MVYNKGLRRKVEIPVFSLAIPLQWALPIFSMGVGVWWCLMVIWNICIIQSSPFLRLAQFDVCTSTIRNTTQDLKKTVNQVLWWVQKKKHKQLFSRMLPSMEYEIEVHKSSLKSDKFWWHVCFSCTAAFILESFPVALM